MPINYEVEAAGRAGAELRVARRDMRLVCTGPAARLGLLLPHAQVIHVHVRVHVHVHVHVQVHVPSAPLAGWSRGPAATVTSEALLLVQTRLTS